MRNFQEPMALFKSTQLLEAAFTAAATDIVTCSGHGFSDGDKIRLTTSGADLPAGLSTGTDYFVVKIDANTFYLNSSNDVLSTNRIDVTDAGTGTHTLHLKSKVFMAASLEHLFLSWATANSADFTAKIQISNQEDVDFESAASATNDWTYVQNIKNENGSTVDGDTGISPTVAGTDENKRFAINIDGAVWICADITSWTAGSVSLEISGVSN